MICFVIVAVVSLVEISQFAHFISSKKVAQQFLNIFVFSVPTLLFRIFPILTYISVIYTYVSLIKNKNIFLLKSVGLNSLSIAVPGLIFSILITLVSYYITASLMPYSYGRLKNFLYNLKNTQITEFIKEKIPNKISSNLTIYIDKKIDQYTFENIVLLDDNKQYKIFIADKARIILEDKLLKIELFNGFVHIISNKHSPQSSEKHLDNELDNSNEYIKNNDLKNFEFNNMSINLDLSAKFLPRKKSNHNEFYIKELFTDKNQTTFILQRLLWPLYNFILVYLGLGVLLKFHEVNYKIKLILGAQFVGMIFLDFILNAVIQKNYKLFYLQPALLLIILTSGVALYTSRK